MVTSYKKGVTSMKICCKCKVEKEFQEFQKASNKPDGFTVRCKICLNEDKRKYLDSKREEIRKYNRNKYYKDQDKQRALRTERSKKLREENSEWIRNYKKDWWAKHAPRVREKQNKLRKLPENKEKRKLYLKEKRSDEEFKKMGARRISVLAIKHGFLIRPSFCSKCLKECKPEGHHDDYDKPLEVRWLCRICHNHEHGKLLDLKP